jgi:hypothetical protein
MFKFAAALAIGLALSPSWQGREDVRNECIHRCIVSPTWADPEVQRQEIVSLEKEAARAIQQSSGTFFRRVYSEDYAGTLSHGQQVNRAQWIDAVESPSVKRESFNASDIKVRIYQDMAIATCLWSSRFTINGQRYSSQFRAVHVYINTPRGWHVVSGQATNLPPDVQQPL